MEIKLNKLDLELVEKVRNKTITDKVHHVENHIIENDYKDQQEPNCNNFENALNKKNKKKNKEKIMVLAEKSETIGVQAFKDEKESETQRGRFLDTTL